MDKVAFLRGLPHICNLGRPGAFSSEMLTASQVHIPLLSATIQYYVDGKPSSPLRAWS